jgi:plastocyanin
MRYDHGLRATFTMVAVLAGLAGGQALAADAQVKIANFTFDPPTLTVKAGTTVTWINADDIPHLVSKKERQVPLKRARHQR